MKNNNESTVLAFRLLVGYLGEQSQFNWWPSKFFAPESGQFLDPIFSKTANLARYHGVTEAARIAHDEHIGIGRVFHAFRLPEVMEQRLFEALRQDGIAPELQQALKSKDSAIQALRSLADGGSGGGVGPTQVGTIQDLASGKWVKLAAADYLAAFTGGRFCYPYLLDTG